MSRFFLLLLILIVSGCLDTGGFYDRFKKEDLWRLPLIEPYELIIIAGAQRGDEHFNWHLNFRHFEDSFGFNQVNVTMINVEKGIIYGYGTVPPCAHFIINTSTGEENEFTTVRDWETQLTKLGADFRKVYDVYDLFEKFRDNKYLAWRPK